MNQVTFYRNFKYVIEHAPLEILLKRIQNGYYRNSITPLRKLYKEGKHDEYAQAKKFLIACTISGMFDGIRRLEFLIEYSYYMVFDIDDLSDEYVKIVKDKIILSNYVLACFISPSGNGLKVIVQVSTGVEEHLRTFLSLQQYLQILTGVEIDPSGKDVTRLCFVSYDPDLYFNPEATVFSRGDPCGRPLPPKPKPSEKEGRPQEGRPQEGRPHEGSPHEGRPQEGRPHEGRPQGSPLQKSYQDCIDFVSRYHTFVEGHRNDFIFALALQLRKQNLPEEFVTFLLLHDYNYNENEVRNTIQSAFKYNLTNN